MVVVLSGLNLRAGFKVIRQLMLLLRMSHKKVMVRLVMKAVRVLCRTKKVKHLQECLKNQQRLRS